MDPKHLFHHLVMNELINKVLLIGNYLPKYKWTYCPQRYWINNPKYVIIMDNFDFELKYFLKNVLDKDIGEIKKVNFTTKKKYTLTNKCILFLRQFYKRDIFLYNSYKNIHYTKRLAK